MAPTTLGPPKHAHLDPNASSWATRRTRTRRALAWARLLPWDRSCRASRRPRREEPRRDCHQATGRIRVSVSGGPLGSQDPRVTIQGQVHEQKQTARIRSEIARDVPGLYRQIVWWSAILMTTVRLPHTPKTHNHSPRSIRLWSTCLSILLGVCTLAVVAPASVAASQVGGAISRDEVIERAQFWVDWRVPYSQSSWYPDPQGRHYRQDCSGMVSMAWHLSTSLATWTLP